MGKERLHYLPKVEILIKDQIFQALLDTGACKSMTRRYVHQKTAHKEEELPEPVCLTYADGRHSLVKNQAKINFKFREIPGAVYKIKALVCENLNYDMILGNEFFLRTKTIFNYAESYIQVDDY